MVNEKLCLVCGYEMEEGPRDYNICPSCGTEFGLYDVNSSITALREVWLSTGPHWYSPVVPEPARWNPIEQMSELFLNSNAGLSSTAVVPTYLPAGSYSTRLTHRKKRIKVGRLLTAITSMPLPQTGIAARQSA